MIKESVWTIGDVNPKCPFKVFNIVLYTFIPGDITISHALYRGQLMSTISLCQAAESRSIDIIIIILKGTF